MPGRDKPILLSGLESMNRSVAGDLVVVELLPEREWKSIGEEVVDSDQKQDDPDALPTVADDDDSKKNKAAASTGSDASIVPNPPAPTREVQPTGRVVGIVRRAFRPYVCTLDLASLPPSALTSSTSTTILASPVSRQIPRIRILTRQAAHLASQKFLVSIDRWSITSRYPEGHFVRVLGQVGSKEGEVESLLEEWEVPYRPFSSAILNCLPEEGDAWVVPSKEDDPKGIWNGREDLRNEIVCSIDPPGCQDIDDALHAKRLPNGNIEAGVRELVSSRLLTRAANGSLIVPTCHVRHCRRFALCPARQPHGRRSCIEGHDGLLGRQTHRHVASPARYQPVLPTAIRREARVLCNLGTLSSPCFSLSLAMRLRRC